MGNEGTSKNPKKIKLGLQTFKNLLAILQLLSPHLFYPFYSILSILTWTTIYSIHSNMDIFP